MNNKEIIRFFYNLNKVNLSKKQKIRMMKFLQIEGKNKVRKIMSYKEFKSLRKENVFLIKDIILGPDFNRVLFIDIEMDL